MHAVSLLSKQPEQESQRLSSAVPLNCHTTNLCAVKMRRSVRRR
jgi:hypothetical protein